VRQLVRDVRKPRPARFQFADQRQRLLNSLVHRVGHVAQRIENEIVQVSK